MSIFGQLMAGAGQAAAQIGNKYIDEEMATSRAQMLADLQRKTAGQIREDDDAFQNDPTRVQRNRQRKTDDIVAEGGARTRVDLERASNTALTEAEAGRSAFIKKAEAQAGIDVTTAAGNDPKYIKALKTISAANAAPDRTDYKGRELDNAIKQMQVDNALRADGLRKEFGTATPERQQQIKDELSVLTGKDADKFVPVPLKDADGTITGYQVFDTKSGKFIDGGAAAADSYTIKPGAKPAGKGDPYAKPEKAAQAAPRAAQPVGPTGEAEQEIRRARAELNGFGSRQRQENPAGFERAKKRLADAEAALTAVQEAGAPPITPETGRAAVRYPTP